MEGYEYHFELNSIVEDVEDSFSRYDVSSKRLELEIKYAFLKKCKNEAEFKAIEQKSLLRPVIINELKNARDFKINALCKRNLHKNAIDNLKTLSQKSPFEQGDKYLLYYRGENEQKFIFDSTAKGWKILEKSQLFHRQYDIVTKKKLFRIDSSLKSEVEVQLAKMKVLLAVLKPKQLFLRFKHAVIYQVYEFFNIQCSIVYETDDEERALELRSMVEKYGEDITSYIEKVMKQEEFKINTKQELELKFTEKGLDFLRQCNSNERKVEISKALNVLRDLTDVISTQQAQLIKMMKDLSLQPLEKPQPVKAEQQPSSKDPQSPIPPSKFLPKEQQQQHQLQFIVRRT